MKRRRRGRNLAIFRYRPGVAVYLPNPLDPFNGHYRHTKSRTSNRVLLVFGVLACVIIAPPVCYATYAIARSVELNKQTAIIAAGIAYLAIVFVGPVAYDVIRSTKRSRSLPDSPEPPQEGGT